MELEVYQELKNEAYSLPFSTPPMKKSETRDSISSIDSDVSLSFDRRGSKNEGTDLSDYDNENRFANKINIDQDSGADSVEDVISKELKTKKSKVLLEKSIISTAEETIDNLVLNDELIDKICAQVEFYFSDENIIKDAFLLKHVKRNKEGYVSLKLISSFKRIKHLSKDWRVIGTALAKSKKLEVNLQGTKLRRVDPLPPFDQTASSRTILAANLPVEKLTIESVAGIFKSCGEIALIRVLRPGHPAPSEIRHTISKKPELASWKEYAMIEFTDSISARIATQMSLGNAKVFELHKLADKKKKNQFTKKNAIYKEKLNKEREDRNSLCSYLSESDPEDKMKTKKNIPGYPVYHINTDYPSQVRPSSPNTWLSRKLSSCSISNSENIFMFRRLSSDSSSNSESNRRYSTCSSDSEAGFYQPGYMTNFYQHGNRRCSCCSSTGSSMEYGENYYVTSRRGSIDYGPFLRRLCSRDSGYDMNIRRLSLDYRSSSLEQNEFYRSRSNSGITMMHLPENVMRFPSGPDGTRGFFCRSAKTSMPIESIY